MRKLLIWLDNNLLSLLTGFLIIFIPLYPKFPMFDILPGYIVRIRLEDFFILFAFVLFSLYLLRGKIKLFKIPLAKFFLIYLFIGFLSVLSAIYLTKTIPYDKLHIAKAVLHFLRRAEYFSLFFIFFASIKTLKQIKIYLAFYFGSLFLVTLYGYGQKYLSWPVISTMNREFSKGMFLYLTPNARVPSTFGGHYDLAAYLLIMLTLLWGLILTIVNRRLKFLFFLILSFAFWLFILSASRTSFIAYLVSISFLIFILGMKKDRFWIITRLVGVLGLSIAIMLTFGDLSERFAQVIKLERIKEIVLSPIRKPPKDATYLTEVIVKSDEQPEPKKPADVYVDVPETIIITPSDLATEGAVATVVAKPRTYSDTALKYGLSIAIRLDALWPRAIAGFYKNPLLGSGYSTLTKEKIEEFTEAESTDNDYLRMLGETGLLGLISFMAIIFGLLTLALKKAKTIKDNFWFAVTVGLSAGIIGLLVNALYIDVFEASKVAYTFWGLMGILMALVSLLPKKRWTKNI